MRTLLAIIYLSLLLPPSTASVAANPQPSEPNATNMAVHESAHNGLHDSTELFNINSYQLNNGIPVITRQRGDNNRVSIQLVVDTGLIDYPCHLRHLPHVIEHVLFEETQQFSGAQLRKRIYDKGGSWQGFTTDEYTHFTLHIHSDFAELAVDTLHQMVASPTLSQTATTNAIRTVNTEMGTSNNLVKNWLSNQLSVTEQGKNRLYPGTHLDCKKRHTPNDITAEQVASAFKKYYVPKNFTLIVVGHFKEQALKQLLNQRFGSIPNKQPPPRTALQTTSPINYDKITVTERYGDPSTYVNFFVRADGKGAPGFYNWQLISLYLTEQLFKEIRTKRGIGYSPSVIYSAGTNIGHLQMSVRTTDKWYQDVERITLQVYSQLKNQGIAAADIERLKKRMLYQFEARELSNNAVLQIYRHNRSWIKQTGKMRQLIHEIKAINANSVRNTIKQMPEKPLLANLRPNSLMEAIGKLVAIVLGASLLAIPLYKRIKKSKNRH